MRQSRLFMPTLREAPAEAETASHRLLLRAGYIRQHAAGIYSYLPLGYRVLRRIEAIVRSEMERAGVHEMLLPAMQTAELWQESGRLDQYGPELIRLNDRHGRGFVLGPTHEEAITSLVREELHSYRELPQRLYQIQTKFRDERRPRSGLMRGREFLMKDAYSFDIDAEGLNESYRTMYDAYHRIFTRCGLYFRAVEADPGQIGGEGGSHEFIALAETGEDTVAVCDCCGYSANVELAEIGWSDDHHTGAAEESGSGSGNMEKRHTPGIRTVEELSRALGIGMDTVIKTLVYQADDRLVAVVIRGDREVNELKLQKRLNAQAVKLAEPEAVREVTGMEPGFIGPVGLELELLIDRSVEGIRTGAAGAGEADYHWVNVKPGIDFPVHKAEDLAIAAAGDHCTRCGEGRLAMSRGIEVGHVFKLGTKYSTKLGAAVTDAAGMSRELIMGCYGIGISRLLAAVAEQHHDEQGLVWPSQLAPYSAHLLVMSMRDEAQTRLAEQMYQMLETAGLEPLLDDRVERPGVKFNDAALAGIPYVIVIGKGAAEGKVELQERHSGQTFTVSAEEAVRTVSRIWDGTSDTA